LVAFNLSTAFTVAVLPPTPITFPLNAVRATFFASTAGGPVALGAVPANQPETIPVELKSVDGAGKLPLDSPQPIQPTTIRIDVTADTSPVASVRHGKRMWETFDANNIEAFLASIGGN